MQGQVQSGDEVQSSCSERLVRVGNKMVLVVVNNQIRCYGIPLHHQFLQGCTQDWHYSVVQILHKHRVLEALPLL